MSVRMRHTSGHTRNRRSHHALKQTNLLKDAESGALRKPHRLDESTGMYRGKLIAPKKVKAVKKDTKAKSVSVSHEGHSHEHMHESKPKETHTKPKGILGKVVQQRTKSRSATGPST